MKIYFVLTLIITAFCRGFAVTIDVPRLPASPHVDGESSADISISGKPPESELRRFKLKMRLDPAGNPSCLIFKGDSEEFEFPGLCLSPISVIFKPEWSMMRVVSRGCGAEEKLTATLSADGGVIILR